MKAGYGLIGVSVMIVVTVASVPAVADQSQATVSSCAQNSQTVTRAIDAATARIEDARQTNDAARIRAAAADMQVTLAEMKTQLADCVSLSQAGGAAAGMAGMDHSKMNMTSGAPVAPPGSASPAAAAADPHAGHTMAAMPTAKAAAPTPNTASKPFAGRPTAGAEPAAHDMSGMPGMKKPAPAATRDGPKPDANADRPVITLQSQPKLARVGENQFDVTVKDENGVAIGDADVSLAFFMPAMPSMKMAEMRSSAKLTPAGDGVYRGKGSLGMAGPWDATVVVFRDGKRLGSLQTIVTVR